MSNTKKPKKLRTPNVPMGTIRVAPPSASAPTAARTRNPAAPAPRTALRTAAPAPAEFDYSYIKQDLRRIAILAGGFIVVLIGLSFFIR